ncbi:MAG: helix-turn-helix transcriptional regulator [Lysobacter sp.]
MTDTDVSGHPNDDEWYTRGLFWAAHRYIDEHLDSAVLDAEQIGKAIGCSRASVYRLFARRRTTVREYIQETRLRRSRWLLERAAPEIPIGTIAERCGFNDLSSFGKMFRRRYGLSPREFRRALDAADTAPTPAQPNR